jgi:hypothetical protein
MNYEMTIEGWRIDRVTPHKQNPRKTPQSPIDTVALPSNPADQTRSSYGI